MQTERAKTVTPFFWEQVSVHHPQETALANSKTAHIIQGHKSYSYPHAPAIPLPSVGFFLTAAKITALFQNIHAAFITLNTSQHLHTGALITTLTLLVLLVPL